jgi:hypothetical protein
VYRYLNSISVYFNSLKCYDELDGSECQVDVYKIETQHVVVIMTVLSLCTDAEDSWLEVNSCNGGNLWLHLSL